MTGLRSLLFVPGDDEKKLAKALHAGADALIVDLEDSVAPARKQAARAIAAAFVASVPACDRAKAPRLFIRINALDTGLAEADLAAVMASSPDGIVLPKSQSGTDVQMLATQLAVAEAELGQQDGATRILAIATETALSLFGMGSYRHTSRRLLGLAWGGEDLSADLGALTNRDPDGGYAAPYRLARALTLIAATAAETLAIDSVFTAFRDLDGLEAECRTALNDGFSAKMAIHPAQVPVINRVFTPDAEAVRRAQAILAAFAAQPDAGVLGVDGEMVDRPHIRRAERLLARAGLANAPAQGEGVPVGLASENTRSTTA